MKKLAHIGLLALSLGVLGACDDRAFHQDRPGGSDYQGGRWSRDSGRDWDRRDETARGSDIREWCYRHPDARECR
jgi:hypothetical protein